MHSLSWSRIPNTLGGAAVRWGAKTAYLASKIQVLHLVLLGTLHSMKSLFAVCSLCGTCQVNCISRTNETAKINK